jgi:hypothetical protein
LHPLESAALSRRTPKAVVLHSQERTALECLKAGASTLEMSGEARHRRTEKTHLILFTSPLLGVALS